MWQRAEWSSLEVTKLTVSALTPVAVAILGVYLTRLAKRFEHLQWRNQQLIEKRIAVYDSLAPQLNDLLCYFTFVGCWKDLTPPDVIRMKREIDKKVYLAAPLFSPAFFDACGSFLAACFATYQGWGHEPRLRTSSTHRKVAAGQLWKKQWDDCFAEDSTEPADVRIAYQRIMMIFSQEIGLTTHGQGLQLGSYPTNSGGLAPDCGSPEDEE